MSHSYSLRSKNPVSYGEHRTAPKNANEVASALLGDADNVPVPRANSELSAPLASQAASDGSWAVAGALLDNRNMDTPEGESPVRKDSGTGSGMPRRHSWSPELGRSPAPRNEELYEVRRAVAQAREVVTGVESQLKGLAEARNVSTSPVLQPIAKGKATDPRNWGNINIPEGDLDVSDQERELNFYKSTKQNHTTNNRTRDHAPDETERLRNELKKLKQQYKDSKRKKEQLARRSTAPLSNELESKIKEVTTKTSFKRSREERADRRGRGGRHSTAPLRRDPLRPSNQIAPDSILSQAFEGVGGPTQRKSDRKAKDRGNDAEGESTPSPSSEDDSDSSQESPAHDDDGSEPSDDSSESSGSSGDESISSRSRSRHRHHRRRRRRRRRHSRIQKKPIIAPTPPEKYDGTADVAKFYRFVTESQAYLKEGKVKPRAQIQKLAKHLTEKAQRFYTTEVIYDLAQWDTQKFFTELFNYCFPADFHLKQQKRLDSLRQGNWTVREFANELKLMFRTVGHIEKHEQVLKLWRGLNGPLQRALWIESLDPQLSSWDEVLETAERHERALNLGNERQDFNQGGNNSRGGGSFRNTSTSNNTSRRDDNRPRARRTQATMQGSNPKPRSGNVQSKKRQLSEQDKETYMYRAEGRCFECGETGHLARNCPKARSVTLPATGSSTGSSRNPFRANHNVNLTQLDHTEALREISAAAIGTAEEGDGAEVDVAAATLELWSIHLDVEVEGVSKELSVTEEERTPTISPRSITPTDVFERRLIQRTLPVRTILPAPRGPREYLGDPMIWKVIWIAEVARPFPGDPECERTLVRRFTCSTDRRGDYILEDQFYGEEDVIPRLLLRQPFFFIGQKLAQTKASRRRMDWPERYRKAWFIPFSGDELWAENACSILETGQPWYKAILEGPVGEQRRYLYKRAPKREGCGFYILDNALFRQAFISMKLLRNQRVNIRGWHEKHILEQAVKWYEEEFVDGPQPKLEDLPDWGLNRLFYGHERRERIMAAIREAWVEPGESQPNVESPSELWAGAATLERTNSVINAGGFTTVQRNASVVRDPSRTVAEPLRIVVKIARNPARALIDSGSLGDFISSTLVDQLKLEKKELASPVGVQLAVQGSRTRVNYGVDTLFEYQNIKSTRHFDVMNLSNYDLILGTPWLYQHQVSIGLNPPRVIIGCLSPLEMKGRGTFTLASRSMQLYEENLDAVREELLEYAKPLCKKASDCPLPPLRVINHVIPLIDESKIYSWRPSRCPEALLPQWVEKRDAYIKTGRWAITNSTNTVPMLCIIKPRKPGEPPRLRTVVDLRERNKNTNKLASPLPDMDGILRRAARARYRSLIDGQDAYEQIRIVPEHVHRSAVTTPDGNMVSYVIQQGDCNAPATYQSLMNYLFSAYIGRFMDVYLDDIVIYSDTLNDHTTHVKLVLDILRREKLYLTAKKLQFLCKELRILGRVIDDDGIRMDPDKVDALVKWKEPTNRDLLRGFLGAAGYLADDIDLIRIPMGILHSLTSDSVPWRWDHTHQRAFDEIKGSATRCKGHHRKPLRYGPDTPPVNMVTDGCVSGIAGVISQGVDWKTAPVAAFYSAKLSPAQQNYPVHEIELLAGYETMLRYRDILQGVRFRWYTDHRGLIHLLNQRNLSGRQARWMERIGEFEFEVIYVPGAENILSDALSRLYSNDSPGTVRAASEYAKHDDTAATATVLSLGLISLPMLVGLEARAVTLRSRRRSAPSVQVDGPRLRLQDSRGRRLVLHGPRERTEGGNGDTAPNNASTESDQPSKISHSSNIEARTAVADLLKLMKGLELTALVKDKYKSDTLFSKVLEFPKEYKNFEVSDDGLVFIKQNDLKVLCIPDVKMEDKRLRTIIISEAHTLLAHLGPRKTADYLREHVWWKTMIDDTKDFCEACEVCKRSKPSNQKPYGLLHPPELPKLPWESIGIDFVGPLPESKNRDSSFDSITVIIDLMTLMVHLVPSCTTYTAKQVAELVFAEVYKYYGLPRRIVSDRDKYFTSIFWEKLHELIGTKLSLSSAYHPQSDGSTERAIRTVEQMLRHCISPDQKDWVQRLPAVEFAINCARSESTGYSPFFLNSGRIPRAMIWNSHAQYAGVRVFAQRIKLALMQAHDALIAARVKSTFNANRRRQEVPFKAGDLVYISTQNISITKGLARKLAPKFIGPYRILKDFQNGSFQISLPADLKRRGIHDVFHASLLRIHHSNDDQLFPARSEAHVFGSDENAQEWMVDRITAHAGSKQNAVFELRGSSGDVTWLPYHQISHLRVMQEYLEALGLSSISALPEGTGTPPDDAQTFSGAVHTYKEGENPFNATQPLAYPTSLECSSIACHTMDIGTVDDAMEDAIDFGDLENEEPPAVEQTPSSRPPPSLPLSPLPLSSRISSSTNQEPPLTVNPTQLTLSPLPTSLPDGSFRFGPFRITYPQPFPQLPFIFSSNPGFYQICDRTTNSIWIFHVAQIKEFFLFDDSTRRNPAKNSPIPGGYTQWAAAFNSLDLEWKFSVRRQDRWVADGPCLPKHVWDIDYPSHNEIAHLPLLREIFGRTPRGQLDIDNVELSRKAVFNVADSQLHSRSSHRPRSTFPDYHRRGHSPSRRYNDRSASGSSSDYRTTSHSGRDRSEQHDSSQGHGNGGRRARGRAPGVYIID